MNQPYKQEAVNHLWQPDSYTETQSTEAWAAQRPSDWTVDTGRRPQCAAPGCNALSKFWKRTGRPVIEGQWACGRACLTKLVEAAVWREMSGGTAGPVYTHRVPLGLVMLAQQTITQQQLHQALAIQRKEGHGRIGEWLVAACGVDPANVTRALGVQWKCPVFALTGFDPRIMSTVLPAPLRQRFGLLPIRLARSGTLYLGAAEAPDPVAALALERMNGVHVEHGIIAESGMRDGSERLDKHAMAKCLEARARNSSELIETIVSALMQTQPVASRIVRMHDVYWLRMWLEPAALSGIGTIPASSEDVVDLLYRVGSGSAASA